MFQSLDEPSTIGIKISVAILTFLYAVIIFTANSIVAQKIVKELMNREK